MSDMDVLLDGSALALQRWGGIFVFLHVDINYRGIKDSLESFAVANVECQFDIGDFSDAILGKIIRQKTDAAIRLLSRRDIFGKERLYHKTIN